jgi:hypothetical protein
VSVIAIIRKKLFTRNGFDLVCFTKVANFVLFFLSEYLTLIKRHCARTPSPPALWRAFHRNVIPALLLQSFEGCFSGKQGDKEFSIFFLHVFLQVDLPQIGY